MRDDQIKFSKNSFCRNCGNLEPYTPVYTDEEKYHWCLDCAISNEKHISNEQYTDAARISMHFKAIYHKLRYEEIMNELKERIKNE